jgi:hypothetical protein
MTPDPFAGAKGSANSKAKSKGSGEFKRGEFKRGGSHRIKYFTDIIAKEANTPCAMGMLLAFEKASRRGRESYHPVMIIRTVNPKGS